MVAHAFNPSYSWGWSRRITWAQSGWGCSEPRSCHYTPAWETEQDSISKTNRQKLRGWAWWLMPVIPALWEADVGRSPEIRSLRPAWLTWWNPISTKNTRIRQAWRCVPIIPATWEAETGKSLNSVHHRTPAWVIEWDSISNKTKLQLKKKKSYW